MRWQDECADTSGDEGSQSNNNETHTCSHSHSFEECGQADNSERDSPGDTTEKSSNETEYNDLPGLIALSDNDKDDDYQETELDSDWL